MNNPYPTPIERMHFRTALIAFLIGTSLVASSVAIGGRGWQLVYIAGQILNAYYACVLTAFLIAIWGTNR